MLRVGTTWRSTRHAAGRTVASVHALANAVAVGLAKGLVVGVGLGLALSYGLGWPLAPGSLLAYLAAMAAAGTTGVLGTSAPWREGAWKVAAIKALAGVVAGGALHWMLSTYADGALPAGLFEALGVPLGDAPSPASWLFVAPLSVGVVSAAFGLFVELDRLGETDGRSKPYGAASAAAATRRKGTDLENADTELATRSEGRATRRAR